MRYQNLAEMQQNDNMQLDQNRVVTSKEVEEITVSSDIINADTVRSKGQVSKEKEKKLKSSISNDNKKDPVITKLQTLLVQNKLKTEELLDQGHLTSDDVCAIVKSFQLKDLVTDVPPQAYRDRRKSLLVDADTALRADLKLGQHLKQINAVREQEQTKDASVKLKL